MVQDFLAIQHVELRGTMARLPSNWPAKVAATLFEETGKPVPIATTILLPGNPGLQSTAFSKTGSRKSRYDLNAVFSAHGLGLGKPATEDE
jgi:hypothetical protein